MLRFEDEAIRMKEIYPKEMVVYRDGKVEKWHFEEQTVGVTFMINVQEKKDSHIIKEAYDKWKNQNL